MIYKPYGNTGKVVSAVGFGGMRFNLIWKNEKNAELVQYAYQKGINYFDTAPEYTNHKSEKILGLAFKRMAGAFYVATKGMPTICDTAQKAKDAVKRSLDRLSLAKIHFYHVWCVRSMAQYELAMKPGGQYDGLRQCQADGLIDHIVFSSHQPEHEIRRILDEGRMEGVLLSLSLLNFPYRWPSVLHAYQHGYGVAVMNPLGGGIIPKYERKLRFLSAPGETATEAALRFVIASPQITVALNGFSKFEQVDMACRIADHARSFRGDELESLTHRLGQGLDGACTGCGYCKPCPQQIPIPSYMQFYNEKYLFRTTSRKMREKLKDEYEWGRLVSDHARASACTACGTCEQSCTQHLPIITRLREIAVWETSV